MAKAAEAFRTISEVADDLGIQKHVLRFWEVKFSQIRPMKRGGGRRYYRPEDMELLRGIRQLLHRDGYTIRGVQKILREQGVEAVKERARLGAAAHGAAPPPEPPVRTAPQPSPQAAPQPSPQTAPRARSRVKAGPPNREAVIAAVIEELTRCREVLAGRATPGGVARTAATPASPRSARRRTA